eukprot:TRINITY_DN32354_c0_g1_i1.p1 TRINITY_DN32354_c0_g1~~TRINITY_DN32354_c0_g1_i1.p1  ORF type:complete len:162 (+),score=30.18 TRINITY_DN32354_c0_g1_i1:64-549(+)
MPSRKRAREQPEPAPEACLQVTVPAPPEDESDESSYEFVDQPAVTTSGFCKFFMSGGCSRGPSCPYKHLVEEEPPKRRRGEPVTGKRLKSFHAATRKQRPAALLRAGKLARDQECPICLEFLSKGQLCVVKTCSHTFHSKCLRSWVRYGDDCPSCATSSLV